jgi:hypothetical protein
VRETIAHTNGNDTCVDRRRRGKKETGKPTFNETEQDRTVSLQLSMALAVLLITVLKRPSLSLGDRCP